jgi:hypothetical protein
VVYPWWDRSVGRHRTGGSWSYDQGGELVWTPDQPDSGSDYSGWVLVIGVVLVVVVAVLWWTL